ncbi:hypothetical protein [Amycolatopsis magusensis]|uniref:Uncharacterized protein n=1 Tax=Amycolatopsis magusensis TaxID=882444 RepID=A0ABS4PHK5_9PSEU|nr:hypothetical protein [Amycolatopsis magusensis]MBP2178906.1 hypothetical protein [Amycolatopsis magusensis]
MQEKLDWEVNRSYGLTPGEDLVAHPDMIPGLNVDEQAFEVVLAERSHFE